MMPLLQVGADIEEVPVWGMDCYTHKNVFEALSRCPELVPAGCSEENSALARNAFLQHRLLPAINAQGVRGWCVVKFC